MESLNPEKSGIAGFKLFIIYFLSGFLFLLLVFGPALNSSFAHRDDYHFWSPQLNDHTCCGLNRLFARGILQGRGIAALEIEALSTVIYNREDLRVFRGISVLFFSVSLSLLALWLRRQGLTRLSAFFVSALIFVLPGVQYYILMVNLSTVSFSMILLLIAVFLLSRVYSNKFWESGVWSGKAIGLSAVSFLLLIISLNIYQPSTMFFLVPILAFVLFNESEEWSKKRLVILHSFSVFFLSMGAYFLIHQLVTVPLMDASIIELFPEKVPIDNSYVIATDLWQKAHLCAIPFQALRNTEIVPETVIIDHSFVISTDLWQKVHLFFNDISIQSFNVWNIFPKNSIAIFVVVFILTGAAFALIRSFKNQANKNQTHRVVFRSFQALMLVFLFMLLTNTPNLLTSTPYTSYRTIFPYTAVIVLLGVWSFLSILKTLPEQWRNTLIHGAGGLLLILAGFLANKNMVNATLNSSIELSFIRGKLISFFPEIPNAIHAIIPRKCSYIDVPCRYGEFNPGNISWRPQMPFNLVIDELGLLDNSKRSFIPAKKYSFEGDVYALPGDLTIDMNELILPLAEKTYNIIELTSSKNSGAIRWAFNGVLSNSWKVTGPLPFWIDMEFKRLPKAVKQYTIQMGENDDADKMPRGWDFSGSNDKLNWEVLDSRENECGWMNNELRTYPLKKSSPFKYYRLAFKNGNDPQVIRLYSIRLIT